MCVELYRWSIELEGIFILPLAPCGFDTPYLSLPSLESATMIPCTWGLSVDNTLPSHCYASPWSCVSVGIFLKLLRSPTVASEPRFYVLMLYAWVEHKELWAIIVILLTSMSYFGSAVLLDETTRTNITRTLMRDRFPRCALHIGGLRATVSPTLVEPSVATPGPCEG